MSKLAELVGKVSHWFEVFGETQDALVWNQGLTALLEPAPDPKVKWINEDRKWEMVSAYQKAVRRSEFEVADKVLQAFADRPEHWPYIWRRICTTACEDIGPANPTLVNFVIATSSFCTPKTYAQEQYQITRNLTRLMCESMKCRTWCNFSILEGMSDIAIKMAETDRQVEVAYMVAATGNPEEVFTLKDQHPVWDKLSEYKQWVIKNDWRGEKMLRYQIMDPGQPLSKLDTVHPELPRETLFGLPEYAYDMHTRVGQQALARLCYEPRIKQILADLPVTGSKVKALGWGVFLLEGGAMAPALWNPEAAALEAKCYWNRVGYPPAAASKLMGTLFEVMKDGELTKRRILSLKDIYPS